MSDIKEEYLGGYRKDTISNPEYFMEMAKLTARRSPDPSTQVGACFAKKGKLLSVGYNCPPEGWNYDKFPFGNDSKTIGLENTKYPYINHAEYMGVINSGKSAKLKNATCYVTLFPCPECAKIMAACQIKRLVYIDRRLPSTEIDPAEQTLKNCGIEFVQYDDYVKEYEKKKTLKKKKGED